MNNKLDGMTASFIAVDEFKKLNNKQGENKMTTKSSKNKNPCSTIHYEKGIPTGFTGMVFGNGINGYSIGSVLTNQPKNPYWPTKVIHNKKTTIVYFENGDKRVVTCSEEDEFNKEFGFLLALAHEVFGSKDKYRQMYTKKVDKKAYPKMKSNKEKTVLNGGVSLKEVEEIIARVNKTNKVE